MKKVTFKLFFYITLVIIIMELAITYLNTRDRNEIYIKEMQERLKYNSTVLGGELERNLGTVEILGNNFAAGLKNEEASTASEQIKMNADKELQNFMLTPGITGGYYLLDINGSEVTGGTSPAGILSENDMNEFRTKAEGSRNTSGWIMPVYIKDMNTNVALYYMNIDSEENIKGLLVLALDYGRLEEIIKRDEADGEYYFINPENKIFITNNQDIKLNNIRTVENNALLAMIKNIQSSDRKTGVLSPLHTKREFYSFYKLDDKNIFIMKKNASVLQSIEFFVDNIWMIIILNISGIILIYFIIKNVLGRPVSKMNRALYSISEKNLKEMDFGGSKFYLRKITTKF